VRRDRGRAGAQRLVCAEIGRRIEQGDGMRTKRGGGDSRLLLGARYWLTPSLPLAQACCHSGRWCGPPPRAACRKPGDRPRW
jgi:hypothetical protein